LIIDGYARSSNLILYAFQCFANFRIRAIDSKHALSLVSVKGPIKLISSRYSGAWAPFDREQCSWLERIQRILPQCRTSRQVKGPMSTFRKLCLDMYYFTYVFLSAVSSPTFELIFASNEAEREIRMLPLPFSCFISHS